MLSLESLINLYLTACSHKDTRYNVHCTFNRILHQFFPCLALTVDSTKMQCYFLAISKMAAKTKDGSMKSGRSGHCWRCDKTDHSTVYRSVPTTIFRIVF